MPLRLMLCAFILLALGGCRKSESDSGSVVPFRGGGMKALILRPTGLGAGIDKDRLDYTIYSGGWVVGRSTRPVAVTPAGFETRECGMWQPEPEPLPGRVGLLTEAPFRSSVSRPRQRKTHSGCVVELCLRLQGARCGSVQGHLIQRFPDTAGLFIGGLFLDPTPDITY